MSYPYDTNPWDDNYNVNQTQSAQPQSNMALGGYQQGGYANPMDQYGDTTAGAQDQYQQGAGGQEAYDQQYQQEQPAPPPLSSDTRPEPMLKRFLQAHVPLCGACMDTCSSLPFVEPILKRINGDLLVSKVFYFFFYSAFGSLFPLMGVYFKQLGMNPAQVGILTGVRPFIEIFSAPFWNSLAERFQKSKSLLLFSLLSWIVFTYSLAHIRPPASACIAFNDTDYVLYTPYSANDLSNIEVSTAGSQLAGEDQSGESPKNEMFLSQMPTRKNGDEIANGKKDEILANEENQNDQGRRRRRRRKRQVTSSGVGGARREQLTRPKGLHESFVYTLDALEGGEPAARPTYYQEAGGEDSGYESQPSAELLELDLDLENDFDDSRLNGGGIMMAPPAPPHRNQPGSQIEASDELAGFSLTDAADTDDAEADAYAPQGGSPSGLGGYALRYKRSSLGEDDVPSESDEATAGGNEENEDERSRERTEEAGGEEQEETDESGGDNGQEAGNMSPTMRHNLGRQHHQQTAAAPGSRQELPDERAARERQGGNGELSMNVNKTKRVYKQRHKTPPTHIVGMSPIKVAYAVNYNKDKHGAFVTPMFSTIVYKLDDIKEVFFLLLLLISLGEFFSAPALTIADGITLTYLGENTDHYGRQRMFGSLSWAITLLLVGMALDNSTSIADHPCGPHQRERSYTVCFAIFSLLMACAFITATQFRFDYPKGGARGAGKQGEQVLVATSGTADNTVVSTLVGGNNGPTGTTTSGNIDQLYASTQPRNIFNTAPPVNAPPPDQAAAAREKFEFLDKWKSAVFAQNTWELPEWMNVFRQFGGKSIDLMYLFITWFLGCGVGLVFTFLFWHLQDVGGTPTLFGICSVINHISEIFAYFFSSHFIKRFGHTKVLSVGLGCNVIRFLYVAFLSNPYYALPFELVQGITHAACFAACCSYISHVSKPELRTSTQGVMQGLHHGIGRACGALIGGYMINAIGSRASFCIYGLLSGCVLAGFLYVRKKASSLGVEEAIKAADDGGEALGGFGAPQGVPSTIPGKMTQMIQPPQETEYQW